MYKLIVKDENDKQVIVLKGETEREVWKKCLNKYKANTYLKLADKLFKKGQLAYVVDLKHLDEEMDIKPSDNIRYYELTYGNYTAVIKQVKAKDKYNYTIEIEYKHKTIGSRPVYCTGNMGTCKRKIKYVIKNHMVSYCQ